MSWLKRFLRKHRRRSPADPSKPLVYRRGNSPIEIGRYTYGHEQLKIRQWEEGAALSIGSFCSIADAIQIFLGGNHRTDWMSTFPFGHVFPEAFGADKVAGNPATRGDVRIGHDVWIGSGATIMSGVTIGDGAVIGARAIVTHDVPPYAVIAGMPARIIRHRHSSDHIDKLLESARWTLPIDFLQSAPLKSPDQFLEYLARHPEIEPAQYPCIELTQTRCRLLSPNEQITP